jgi:multimeric flavodoxin WrbA
MKLLAVVGSPRKRGNTDLLMYRVIEGAQDAGAEVQRVFLHGMNISPCDGCRACVKTGACKMEDDMAPLYDALYGSDVWALGTPVYWFGASAQMKTFIDRWYVFCHQP